MYYIVKKYIYVVECGRRSGNVPLQKVSGRAKHSLTWETGRRSMSHDRVQKLVPTSFSKATGFIEAFQCIQIYRDPSITVLAAAVDITTRVQRFPSTLSRDYETPRLTKGETTDLGLSRVASDGHTIYLINV